MEKNDIPTREDVIKALKRIHGYCAAEAHRYGPQKPDKSFIRVLNYLKKEYSIDEKELD